ncbi:MAG: hypothetical protein O2930_00595 [Acidobacteria bacterium]|nr:hypothetical protein [Acidobacteriota bacterium]
MSDRAWWGVSVLVTMALVAAIAVLWPRAVGDYVPHPGQLTSQTAVEEFLSLRPAGPSRVLIPTGIFVQSLHFVTASDVNITGYI